MICPECGASHVIVVYYADTDEFSYAQCPSCGENLTEQGERVFPVEVQSSNRRAKT